VKRYKKLLTAVLVIGIVLLVSVILVFLEGPPPEYATLPEVVSETFDILSTDYGQPFILLTLPLAIGTDIIVWTIGVTIWLFGYGSWPGQALSIFLVTHPVLYYFFNIVSLLLGLFVMVVLPYWIFSAVRKAMNTKEHLDWGSSIVGTITLVMAIWILAQLVVQGINDQLIKISVGVAAFSTGILLPLKYKKVDLNFFVGLIGIIIGVFFFATLLQGIPLSIYSIWFIIYAVRGLLQASTYRTVASSQYAVLMVLNFLLLISGLLGVILPFFTLNSLLLIVVAIALMIESVITWLE